MRKIIIVLNFLLTFIISCSGNYVSVSNEQTNTDISVGKITASEMTIYTNNFAKSKMPKIIIYLNQKLEIDKTELVSVSNNQNLNFNITDFTLEKNETFYEKGVKINLRSNSFYKITNMHTNAFNLYFTLKTTFTNENIENKEILYDANVQAKMTKTSLLLTIIKWIFIVILGILFFPFILLASMFVYPIRTSSGFFLALILHFIYYPILFFIIKLVINFFDEHI
ncbi:hypothetical protein [uncultured Brachyspira sp.]|uniref:hypothetical protein n=1 Tax=uncultured Brachyspira sp. TaxID=221953 RepID=UPI002618CD3B|nr:hypothetical protein [uncultured Brachyspira sp.]